MTDLAAARFEIIAPLLRRYTRRFTVLDVGAGIEPYLAKRISREFDCVYIAAEKDPVNLADVGPRFLWLNHEMTTADLERLSYCEHFDVVLSMNFLHHVADWRSALASLEMLGDHLIVQTPYPSDQGTCGSDITPDIYTRLVTRGTCLGESVQFDGHQSRPIFHVLGNWEAKLSMSNWTSPENCIDARIYSDFNERTIELRHKDAEPVPFIHGLNLWNFAQLQGRYPDKLTVLETIRKFPPPANHHGDVTAHNFIYDGMDLHLIDGFEGWPFSDSEGLRNTECAVQAVLR